MNFKIFLGKTKKNFFLFLVIISLFFTLFFPGITKSQDSASFSIELNINRCSEELIVKLQDQKLFCIQDTEILPDEKHPKFYKQKKKLLKEEADRFSRKIKSFADQKIDVNELKLSDSLEKSEKRKDNYYYLPIVYEKSSKSSTDTDTDTDKDEIIEIGKVSNLDSLDKEWEINGEKWKKKVEQVLNKIQKAIENYRIDLFSIQDDTDKCPEELKIKLKDTLLFCIQDTENLPNDTELKYHEKKAELLKQEANSFSTKIKLFADQKIGVDKLKLSDNPEKSEKRKDNYYYLSIFYEKYSKYFEGTEGKYIYNSEIMKIGEVWNLDDGRTTYSESLKTKAEEVLDKIKEEIKEYRQSFITIKKNNSNAKDNQPKNKEELDYQAIKVDDKIIGYIAIDDKKQEEKEELELIQQAVRIENNILFYIRTWNNRLSPKERAARANDKIDKIIKGKINIQGLGVFEKSTEKSTENEEIMNQKPKIIKVISDSKFLSEEEKEILEVTDNDALFIGEENAAVLAQKYLVKINQAVAEYKKSIEVIDERGYPVYLFDKNDPIFYINPGAENLVYQPSYRASEISKRIKKFAQRNLLSTTDKLVAAYSVGFKELNSKNNKNKGLCLLSESFDNVKYYNKFLENNPNINDINQNDCIIEDLESQGDLQIIYSDEISKKIARGEWQLTNSTNSIVDVDEIKKHIKENKIENLPKTVYFMKLNDDHKLNDDDDDYYYHKLMSIQRNELDPLLHLDNDSQPIKTNQDLAIHFLKEIEERVEWYKSKKTKGLIIFTILLIVTLEIFFKISSVIKKGFLKINQILFMDIFTIFEKSREFLQENISKIINLFKLNNKKKGSIFIKLILLITIIIFVLFNIPKLDILISDFRGIFSKFINDQINIIWSYLYTQIPRIALILITVIILDRIILDKIISILNKKIVSDKVVTKDTSRIEKRIEKIRKKRIEKAEQDKKDSAQQQWEWTLVIWRTNFVILRIIMYIFTIILIAPHLPAAGTIYFQGISAFVVLAFTWSASSVIADLVAGIVLIYSKSLKTKDWIKVGDTIGEIREQKLLFHKIKTAKNCIITIPNSDIIHNFTTNFSASSKGESKLILHTPVGLGYDLPRKEVEMTLIAAAIKTDKILKDDKHTPFVRITNLGDFAVTYELNVYTENPKKIPQIYSDLQKNIQDECNSRGIEILSPSYLALRDGGDSTIPEEYNKPKLFGLERWWRFNNSQGIK